MNKLFKSPLIIISVLLLLSMLIRWPAFKNPVRGSHGWLSAHTVLTAQIWKSEGINSYNYNPVYTYPNQPDKNLRSLASGLPDNTGNFYYVSYPPFSFYLAHIYFSILRSQPDLVSLYVLNVLIQGFTAFLIYLLVCQLYNKCRHKIFKPALMASALYIFSAQNLWCHVYMYFADSLVQVLWVAYLLLAFKIFKREGVDRWSTLLLFTLTNFLIVYTEWLGVFASFVVFIYSLFRSYKSPDFLRISIIIACTTIIALSLTIAQYASIDGLDAFIGTSIDKYETRNGYTSDPAYFIKLKLLRILTHYKRFHQANILLILGLSALALFSIRKQNMFTKDHRFLLSTILLPIAFHHSVFLEFSSMHDFSTMKSSIFFCVLTAIVYNTIDFKADKMTTQLNKDKIASYFFVAIVLLNIALYASEENWTGRSIFSRNSVSISQSSNADETLFAMAKGDRNNGLIVFMGSERAFSTQIQLLTQRNILAVPDRKTLVEHMITYKKTEGKMYIFDLYGKMIGVESFDLNQ